MAGNGFNFLRAVHEAMKMVNDVADHMQEAGRQQQRDRTQSDRPRSEKPDEPQVDLRDLTGLAAMAVAALTQAAQQGPGAAERHRQKKKERNDRKNSHKPLLEHFERSAAEAARDLTYTRQMVHERLSKKENIVKHRADILVVNPSEEPLLKPLEAKRFFEQARSELEQAGNKAMQRVQGTMRNLIELHAKNSPDDPDFEPAIKQALKFWQYRNDTTCANMHRRLENLDAKLAEIRAASTRGAEQTNKVFADQRLLYAPVGRPLNAADFEALTARVLQPRDARLSAQFEDLIEGRITAKDLERALAEFAWNGTALADVFERAVLARHMSSYFRLHRPQQAQPIEIIGNPCLIALRDIAPQEIPLEGEDALRIAAALIADIESRSPLIHLVSWRKLAVVFARMPERLRGYITREEAKALLERVEGPALFAIDATLRNQGSETLFAPYADLMGDLATAARITRPIPALEQWNAFLGQREAARAAVMALASPFWQPMLAQILDTERPDLRDRDAMSHLIYGLLQGFGAFDDGRLEIVAREVETILGDKRRLQLAGRHDGWRTAVGRASPDAVAHPALTTLRDVLAKAPEDRAAYFAPLTEVAGLGDFTSFFEVHGRHGSNPFLAEIDELLSAGAVETAEARLRDWLTKAPIHPVRNAVLAAPLESLVLTGWEAFSDRARDPKVGALLADFSGHCVSNLLDVGDDALWFEDGAITTDNYDFSVHSLEEMRAMGRRYGQPWQGCTDITADLRLRGLAPVFRAIRKHSAVSRPDLTPEHYRLDSAILALTDAWCFTAFAVLVQRRLQTQPLPRAIPVIVGTHDFGGSMPTVIF